MSKPNVIIYDNQTLQLSFDESRPYSRQEILSLNNLTNVCYEIWSFVFGKRRYVRFSIASSSDCLVFRRSIHLYSVFLFGITVEKSSMSGSMDSMNTVKKHKTWKIVNLRVTKGKPIDRINWGFADNRRKFFTV